MKTLFYVVGILCTPMILVGQDSLSVRDTVYNLPPITINPMEAKTRETPASFSNLTRKEISEQYSVKDLPVLLSDLPSATFSSENGNGIGYSYVTMRGFDQRRLSIMVNGVPQNDPEDHNVYWIDVPDLLASTGDVQVQRGAGSAFFGPPAIGGSINLVTDPFTSTPSVTVESMVGFQEFGDSSNSLPLTTKKFSLALSSGLIDHRLVLYGRYGRITSQGYRIQSDVEMSSYFLGAAFASEAMTTRFHAFGGPINDGLAYYGVAKFTGSNSILRRQNLSDWGLDSTGQNYSYLTYRRPEEREHFSQPHFELLNEWHLSPFLTLNNTIFFYSGNGYYDYDASWADTSMLRLGYSYGIPAQQNPYNTLVRADVGNRQWGWLPRLEINHGSGELILGAELRNHRSIHWGKIVSGDSLPPGFNYDYHFYEYNGEKNILSGYIHELYHPSRDVSVMGDLQIVHNRYGIENEKYLGNNFTYSYLFVNPRGGINVNFDERLNSYFSIGYTSREPRLRDLYSAEDSYFGATPQFVADTSSGNVEYDFAQPLAKPEQLLDIELGAGYQDVSLHLTWNLFWMEFTNELVKNGQVDIFGQPVTGNAERTRHTGIEMSGVWTLGSHFVLGGNFSLSRNRLIHYTVYETGTPSVLDGNPIAGFPDILGNIRFTFRDSSYSGTLNYKHVGAFYTDNYASVDRRNDAYDILNFQFLVTIGPAAGGSFILRMEVNNLLNKLYFSNGEGSSFFPAAERNYLFGLTAAF